MIARRIRGLFLQSKSHFPFRNSTHYLSSAVVSNPRFSNSFVDDDEGGGSSIYRLALKFQRPTTVEVHPQFGNRVSFIGTVHLPLKVMNTTSIDSFGVHTFLNVKNPSDSNVSFRIYLKMWDKMAKMCLKHVKPGDFVYVSGHLGSYNKVNDDGQLRYYYQVTVKELNFVAPHAKKSTSRKYKEFVEQANGIGEAGMAPYENPLYLWQVFFSNPFEWWDNRKSKKNPRQPDFKHKDTGEALWLRHDDPPWIRKQLELLDSKLAEGLADQVRSNYRVSEWVYDE